MIRLRYMISYLNHLARLRTYSKSNVERSGSVMVVIYLQWPLVQARSKCSIFILMSLPFIIYAKGMWEESEASTGLKMTWGSHHVVRMGMCISLT